MQSDFLRKIMMGVSASLIFVTAVCAVQCPAPQKIERLLSSQNGYGAFEGMLRDEFDVTVSFTGSAFPEGSLPWQKVPYGSTLKHLKVKFTEQKGAECSYELGGKDKILKLELPSEK